MSEVKWTQTLLTLYLGSPVFQEENLNGSVETVPIALCVQQHRKTENWFFFISFFFFCNDLSFKLMTCKDDLISFSWTLLATMHLMTISVTGNLHWIITQTLLVDAWDLKMNKQPSNKVAPIDILFCYL